jgi:DNA modification methylase
LAKPFISSVWDFSNVAARETGYLTHDFLRWYGKLIPQLVSRVLDLYSKPNDLVLANFSGSGTVALEANLSGRHVIGIDPNPLSLLVSRVKSSPYTGGLVQYLPEIEADFRTQQGSAELGPLIKWFHEGQANELVNLRRAIETVSDGLARDTLLLALASVTKKISIVDARCVNHLVSDHKKSMVDVWDAFVAKAEQMDRSIRDLVDQQAPTGFVDIRRGDARNLEITSDSIDLVISHPPYLGAIDYSNMYQLENAILGFDQIGFKADDISTASLSKYLESMKGVFSEMFRVTKPGGRAVVIIGDNRKGGNIQPTFAHFILDAEQRLGFKLEDIFIWVTSGKAGMSVKRHGNYIDHNYILVFRKPDL